MFPSVRLLSLLLFVAPVGCAVAESGVSEDSEFATNAITAGTTYTLVAKHSNKVLDVRFSSPNDGGNVQQWSSNGTAAQQWKVESGGDGSFILRAGCSGKVLDVQDWSPNEGANVQQWSYGGGDNQKWYLEDAGEGYYYVRSRFSGMYLDVAWGSSDDGANVAVVRKYPGSDAQKWRFAPVQQGGGSGTGSAGGCDDGQRAQCNCPSDFYCCPVDGSCFKDFSDIIYTQCKDNPSASCDMDGSASPGTPAPGTSNPGGGGGALPTRLRITSKCQEPIWIAHSDNVPAAQNILLHAGESHDYPIPDGGLSATRFWPKTGCDGSGSHCTMGDSGEGGGKPCPASGCQPPLDSKFEATFAPRGGADATWYNLSQVDGYTLPFKVVPRGTGAEEGSCVTSDCSGLSLDLCPTSEDLSGGGLYSQYAGLDLRVRDGNGRTIACMAPCKKWNYPSPWGLGQPESADPGLHMCCPTPIDPVANPGQCTAANHCMTSQACSDPGDPVSVTHTRYVQAMRSMCPSAYSYAYDDAAGLHACSSETGFEVIFCP